MADSPRRDGGGRDVGRLAGGLLIDGMQAHAWPGLQSSGIGGPQMARRGFTAWWPSDKLAVHGYSMEVLRRLRELLRIRKQLRRTPAQRPPDVFIGVDAPDFNLGLEADLRAAGIKTVHFVVPVHLGLACRPRRKIAAAQTMCALHLPRSSQNCSRSFSASRHLRKGHPLAGVIPMVPDRTAARAQLDLRMRTKSWPSCREAALPRSSTSRSHSLGWRAGAKRDQLLN